MSRKIIVYLSPSNQINNAYYGVLTTEEREMVEVYKIAYRLFQDYDLIVVNTTLAKRPFYYANSRVDEAIAAMAKIYIALHTNATAKPPSDLNGSVILYRKGYNDERDRLAAAFQRKLNALQPKPIKGTGLVDGYAQEYGEVVYPERAGVMGFLVECTWHDNPEVAKWVTQNRERIARAIVEAVVETYGIKKKSDPTPAPAPAPTSTYIVRYNDSLWEIAAKELGDGFRYKEIMTLNGLTTATIYPGQKLKLPIAPKVEPKPETPKEVIRKLSKGTPIWPDWAKDEVANDGQYTLSEIRGKQAKLKSGRGIIAIP